MNHPCSGILDVHFDGLRTYMSTDTGGTMLSPGTCCWSPWKNGEAKAGCWYLCAVLGVQTSHRFRVKALHVCDPCSVKGFSPCRFQKVLAILASCLFKGVHRSLFACIRHVKSTIGGGQKCIHRHVPPCILWSGSNVQCLEDLGSGGISLPRQVHVSAISTSAMLLDLAFILPSGYFSVL